MGYIQRNEAAYRNNRLKRAQWELYQIKTRNMMPSPGTRMNIGIPTFDSPTRSPPRRTKRGLFDFFGGALHHVFGLATDSDIADVKNMIRNQVKEGNRVVHSVNKLTTVINEMQRQVSVMTGTINTNIRNINSLFRFAKEANATMWKIAYTVRRNQCIYFLDSLLDQLLHVSHLYEHQMLKYTRQRNSLEAGHVSHELLPMTYLQYISKQLNKSSSLVQDLSWYYKNAPITAVRSDDFLVFKVDIHIVDLLDYLEYAITSFPTPVSKNFTIQMRLEAKHIGLNTLSGRMFQPKRCFGSNPRICDGTIQFYSKMVPCIGSIILQKTHSMCAIEVVKTNHTETVVLENTAQSFIVCTFGESIRLLCEKQPPKFMTLTTSCHLLFPNGCVVESDRGWRISNVGVTEKKLTLHTPQLVLDKISVVDILNITRLQTLKVFQEINSELEIKQIVHLEEIPVQNINELEFWTFQDAVMNIGDVLNQLCNLIVILYVIHSLYVNRHKIRDYMRHTCLKCYLNICKKKYVTKDEVREQNDDTSKTKTDSLGYISPSVSKVSDFPDTANSFEKITRECMDWNKTNSAIPVHKFKPENPQDISKISFNVKRAKKKDVSVDVHMDRETLNRDHK